MSQTFKFQRFKKLIVKYTVENYRKFVMSILVISGIAAALYMFTALDGGLVSPSFRFGVCSIFFLLGGSIFTSSIFSDFTDKTKAVSSLTLPASHFEKFLVGWAYSYIIYMLLFVICFGLIDYIFVQLFARAPKINLYDAMPPDGFTVIFLLYTVLHGIVLFGSAYFKNLHFVKTATCLFVLLIFLCFFSYGTLTLLIPEADIQFTPPLLVNRASFRTGEYSYSSVRLAASITEILIGAMVTFVTAALWSASFFQIKEKQI